MPSATRNRLKKRQASPDLLKTAASDAEEESCASSTRSSHDSFRPLLTPARPSSVSNNEDDLGDAQPPPPPKSAQRQREGEFSPPQTVLDRYRKRSVYTTAVHWQRVPCGGSLEDPTMGFEQSSEQRASNNLDLNATSGDRISPTDTRTFSGVQFDMVPKRRGVPPAPIGPEAEHEPPRRTRSQTRMQRRVDSLGDVINVKDFATSSDKRASSTPPRSTGYVRSPSPEELARASRPDLKQLSSTNLSLMPAALKTSTIKPVPQSPSNAGSSNCRSPLDPLLSPLPKSLTHSRQSSTSHKPPTKAKTEDEITISPLVINPPNPLLPTLSPGHLWTSDLAFTSRPYVPWELSKRWACCQCAQRDPEQRAAQTIVEQRVCSRLECRHERCAGGCRVPPSMGFVGLQ